MIGPGGKNIRMIQETTGTVIEVDDDGTVTVASNDSEASKAAQAQIEACTATVQIGRIYDGRVISIKDFGAFVEILPGRDGLCHISELSDGFVSRVSDICAMGDEMKVLVIDIDEHDRVKLSRRRAGGVGTQGRIGSPGWRGRRGRRGSRARARPRPGPWTGSGSGSRSRSRPRPVTSLRRGRPATAIANCKGGPRSPAFLKSRASFFSFPGSAWERPVLPALPAGHQAESVTAHGFPRPLLPRHQRASRFARYHRAGGGCRPPCRRAHWAGARIQRRQHGGGRRHRVRTRLAGDLPDLLDRLIPPSRSYGHEQAWHDGNGHSHLQATLLGPAITIPISEGRLVLGTWQQVFHIECDIKPRRREIVVTVIGD